MRADRTAALPPPARARRRAGTAVALAVALLAACVPSSMASVTEGLVLRSEATPRPFPPAEPWQPCLAPDAYAELLVEPPTPPRPLRGDPAFDPDRLAPAARVWYDRLWDAIVGPEQSRAITATAARDDLYHYGRGLHTHVLALLTAFRVTGDLALLDEVDRIAEHMRAQLSDPWRDTLDRTDGTRDGYVNWVFRTGDSREHQGKDLHTFDEMRTHGLVAEIAWALHHNRDLASPNGVDYGARADVWTSYLLEHFEPKWRERHDVRPGDFPFLTSTSMHATVAFVKYHHYVARITGSAGHRDEAKRLTDLVRRHIASYRLDGATALAWPRTLVEAGGVRDYLQPSTYARYVVGDLVDLHLDGADAWPTGTMSALAHTVRSLVIEEDDGATLFARDIGGGTARAGIAASEAGDWSRPTSGQFTISPTSFVALWDRTGEVAAVACALDEASSGTLRTVHLPTALLLALAGERISEPR
jgi:hypothetical protein